jgi:hypothetical protein
MCQCQEAEKKPDAMAFDRILLGFPEQYDGPRRGKGLPVTVEGSI